MAVGQQKGDEMSKKQTDENGNSHLSAYLECEAIDEYNFQVQAAMISTKVLKLLEKEEAMQLDSFAGAGQPLGGVNARLLRHGFSKAALSGTSSMVGLHSAGSSGLFPTVSRTRSSSWISTQSMRTAQGGHALNRSPAASFMEGPLLDKILDLSLIDSTPKQVHHGATASSLKPPQVQDIFKMITLLTDLHSYCPNSNSVGGTMGATCTVGDYPQVIASLEAMMGLVVSIRALIEEHNPTALISATVPPTGRLIVCGDTHGQLEDLLWVFFKNGFPSASNVYIFNGDICDRGGHALEIFLVLFLFKLNCFHSVHILRGNHEDDYCNIYYGFLAELKHKYGPIAGGTLHTEFLKLFYSLPLACLIDSWFGLYKCNITGALIDLSPTVLEAQAATPSATSNAVAVTLKRKDATNGHKAYLRTSVVGGSASPTVRQKSFPTSTFVSTELVFEKRIAKRYMNNEGHNVISWGSGSDTWEYVSPRLLVLHGGIPVPPNSASLSSSHSPACVLLKHFRDLPHRMKIPPAPKTILEQWMYQILWSDPTESEYGPKGRGTPFFPNQTKSFAEMNNLAGIIRAHQVPSNQRGVSFHHRDKLITVFTASNYCGSSQNFGGVAIFTPSLFPQLVMERTLFEHWAPPLAVTRDILAKHENATMDVRMFIANEIEADRAPIDRNNSEALTHLEQKVAEYVSSLIVQHKRQLWSLFMQSVGEGSNGALGSGSMVVPIETWETVCSTVIGSHFPWGLLTDLLEVRDPSLSSGINFVEFLNRFRSTVRFGDVSSETWEPAVLRGFFAELVFKRKNLEKVVMACVSNSGNPMVSCEVFRDMVSGVLSNSGQSLSGSQIQILGQSLVDLSSSDSGDSNMVNLYTFLQVIGSEYIRSFLQLVDVCGVDEEGDTNADTVVTVGQLAIQFFPLLREAIYVKYSHLEDSLVIFFRDVLAGGGTGGSSSSEWEVPFTLAKERLIGAIPGLGLSVDKFTPSTIFKILTFVCDEDHRIVDEGVNSAIDLKMSLVQFIGACSIDGSPAGSVLRDRVAEHANSAIYFHRNALRVACVFLDKQRKGYLDSAAFTRAINALNQSLDSEWRLSRYQVKCVLHYMNYQAESELVEQQEGQPTSLVVDYDRFLDSFEVTDMLRMSRAASFGWHLVKDSLGFDNDHRGGFSLEGMLEGSMQQ